MTLPSADARASCPHPPSEHVPLLRLGVPTGLLRCGRCGVVLGPDGTEGSPERPITGL